MFEKETTEILLKFLEKKCREAEKEIEEKGTLSDENAIPLLLKTQFNHIAHLDMELTTLREMMDKRFEHLERIIARLFTGLTVGFTILGFLIILFGFLK